MPSFVRRKGLEPPRLSTLDPKSSAATNYANAASLGLRLQSYNIYLNYASVLLIFFVLQSQQASAKLQKVFKKLYFWRRKV